MTRNTPASTPDAERSPIPTAAGTTLSPDPTAALADDDPAASLAADNDPAASLASSDPMAASVESDTTIVSDAPSARFSAMSH
jgi:hypothetical protein